MNKLLVAIVISIICAFGSVFAFEGEMAQFHWLGEMFLRALKMLIVPLVMFSMITGVAGLGDVRKLGRIGGTTVIYYSITTLVAVVLGTVLVTLIEPGVGLPDSGLEIPAKVAGKQDIGMTDILLGFLSTNVVKSMAEMQMLPLIVFSLVFGGVLSTMGERGAPLLAVCEAGNEAMMKMVHLIMWGAPIGIFGLIAGRFGKAVGTGGMDAFFAQLSAVGMYMVTVILGLGIHGLIVLPVMLWLLAKRRPDRYAKGVGSALLTAFSTSSSAATLPMTLEGVEDNNGVDPRAAQLVIPMGATINMDGTALYEAVAVIFIAQVLGYDLSLMQQVLVVITATLAAIGAAGIPEAGLVTMVIVLRAVDLPLEGVELILAVDWLLDRFRTVVNVWGDAVGAAVVERVGLRSSEPVG
ncbi:MAG: dicarboxylate/amino acid:cation symporter [Myxococcales bacterium]|nr:dicarboxylate/amino acid:cation symporter [Myxococcales bacterium]